MKRLPLILGLIFISVTVHRVALFSGGGFNGWAVALALAIGVFLSAYFSEMKTTSKPALFALIAFVLVDGLFNVSEVLRWSVEQGRWDFALKFSESASIYIYRVADPLYGIFPTLAAAMLGWLSKATEKLIVNRKINWKDRLLNGVVDWLLGSTEQTHANAHASHMQIKKSQSIFLCEACEREFNTVQALSAHMRFCELHKNGKANALLAESREDNE